MNHKKYDGLTEKLMRELFSKKIIKFGNFKLKSGKSSPYYVDLRLLISYPKLLHATSNLMCKLVKMRKQNKPNILCGIAAAGIPLATLMSMKLQIPLVATKKEPIIYNELSSKLKKMADGDFADLNVKIGLEKAISFVENLSGFKTHGLQTYLDGKLEDNSKIGLVDDLITTAQSKLEARHLVMLEAERLGLKNITVSDIYVLLDREQGGRETLRQNGITLHSVLKIRPVVAWLKSNGLLDQKLYEMVLDYIANERKVLGLN